MLKIAILCVFCTFCNERDRAHQYHTQLYSTFADRRAAASASTPLTPTAKRRKINDPLTSLIRNLEMGTSASRLLALQVMHFLVDQHWNDLHGEARKDIRRVLIDLLDDDDANIQSWALLGLAFLATTLDTEADTGDIDARSQKQAEDTDWSRVWTYAIRKSSQTATSRAACHAADAILKYGKVPPSSVIGDIDNTLRTLEIQGPPYPYDSVCALLTSMLKAARTDVRLYAKKLEEQVIAWVSRWNALEGMRGKGRMDATTPSDILALLNEACRFRHIPIATTTVEEVLPDCAVVDRVLEEYRLAPIRQYLLHGEISDTTRRKGSSPSDGSMKDTPTATLGFLDGVPKKICRILLDNLTAFIDDWSILPNEEGNKKLESPPDRVRRSIDMIVLSLSFQASLEINGIQPDTTVIQQILQLLRLIRSSLSSPSYSTSALHLVWRGMYPLVYVEEKEREIWPILLKPDIQSGIRQDLLPPSRYGQYEGSDMNGEEGVGEVERLLTVLWGLKDVSRSSLFSKLV
jgi:ataxia telangiectasia mutated family protein